jgi:hypothetical protein
VGVSNTEVYLTDFDYLDFDKELDLSHLKYPVGYICEENNTVRTLKLKFGVGQTLWVRVQITVPRGIHDVQSEFFDDEGYWHFALECHSANPEGKGKDLDNSNNVVLTKLKILLPDLIVASKLFHPRSITNGDIVTVSCQIRNIGDISANEMAIVFYVDGKDMQSKTLTRLDRGRTRLITYTWQAPAGKHELEIKIDPEDNIVEKREDNNDVSSMVEVKESGFLGMKSIREVCSILAIVIAIILVLIVVITIKRKGSFFGFKPGSRK